MKSYGVAGKTVALKLKTSDFKTRTRNKTLADPTQLADRIFRTGLAMLERETRRNEIPADWHWRFRTVRT